LRCWRKGKQALGITAGRYAGESFPATLVKTVKNASTATRAAATAEFVIKYYLKKKGSKT